MRLGVVLIHSCRGEGSRDIRKSVAPVAANINRQII
jgi:hypothetical protein